MNLSVKKMPQELVEFVFDYLRPIDFNAARHTCGQLLNASKQARLLCQMLKRGGWWTSIVPKGSRHEDEESALEDHGRLSRHLARECSLCPGWTGNGIAGSTALAVVSNIDMTDLSGSASSGRSGGCGLGFTVSVCSRYLLVANGCVIYVYRFAGQTLRPVSLVVCPRRVLAMSMDTSANRYAVAALLDGRIGAVCDLASAFDAASNRIASVQVRSTDERKNLPDASQESSIHAINRAWPNIVGSFAGAPSAPGEQQHGIPISSSPLSIYYSLCSPDDPPRCVAICPTRRCIAFGCAAGIELHWIDSRSDKNLMKWFPLTAPSDFLYFIPRRAGFDNPSKLRLISSKAGPGQRGGVDRLTTTSRRRRSRLGWGSSIVESSGVLSRSPDFDHFFALPLSDGLHILFTDPVTGALSLGSDVPFGGPTKLIRKAVLLPPYDVVRHRCLQPTTYAVGRDLSHGVRIVAVYGENIVLFCIPPDVFADLAAVDPALTAEDCREFGEWRDWWDFEPNSQEEPCASLTLSQSASQRPVTVRGVKLASVPGVVDVGVETPDLAIWAVSMDGIVRKWQISSKPEMHSIIDQYGAVVDLVDGDGDYIMRDAPATPACIDVDGDKDGDIEMQDCDSSGWATAMDKDEDGDGDVRMLDCQLDGAVDIAVSVAPLQDEAMPLDVEILCCLSGPSPTLVVSRAET